jgi:hypothetical protein
VSTVGSLQIDDGESVIGARGGGAGSTIASAVEALQIIASQFMTSTNGAQRSTGSRFRAATSTSKSPAAQEW